MNFLKAAFLMTAVIIFAIACSQPAANNSVANTAAKPNAVNNSTAAASPQPTAPVDELAAAKKNYETKCAACHKEDGSGGKTDIEGTIINAENLRAEKMKKMSDEKYIDYIENGVKDEGMPAFKGKLTDQEIKDIVKYIRREFQK